VHRVDINGERGQERTVSLRNIRVNAGVPGASSRFRPRRGTGRGSVGYFSMSKPIRCSGSARQPAMTMLFRKRHSLPSFAAGIRFSCAHCRCLRVSRR